MFISVYVVVSNVAFVVVHNMFTLSKMNLSITKYIITFIFCIGLLACVYVSFRICSYIVRTCVGTIDIDS